MEDTSLVEKQKVAVIGSRDFKDKTRLYRILDKNIEKIEMIVSGGAEGADSLGQEWSKDRGIPCLIYYPKWRSLSGEYDKGAGFKRNWSIIRASDIVLAFWDKKSTGTSHSLEIAQKLNKLVRIFEFNV